MRIAFYMPLKPLNHANPSGDLIIGSELFGYLAQQGHGVKLVSRLRSRWIYWKPWHMLGLPAYRARAAKRARRFRAQLWMSYHSYYKAPDLLGAACARYLNIPYVIFQGIYATKYRRNAKTLPGFWLNRMALRAADLVITNKHRDHRNLKRIVLPGKLLYVAPGIRTELFFRTDADRASLRKAWNVSGLPVVITAAMFRPGVKFLGLKRMIETSARLHQQGLDHLLVIAGDGEERERLRHLARAALPRRHLFLGKIPRDQLRRYFSAADLFAFPGIEESLGMVYLEAQACGLPVAASGQWGAREAVVPDRTGILTASDSVQALSGAVACLIKDAGLRRRMGRAGREHVLQQHDLKRNYRLVEKALKNVVK